MISCNDKLPPEGKYVLVYLNKINWIDNNDPENVYFEVACLKKGISQKERDALDDSDERKRMFRFGDEDGNNKVPYQWSTFGPMAFFGQEVECWDYLPKPTDNVLKERKRQLREQQVGDLNNPVLHDIANIFCNIFNEQRRELND